jgi:hypothetical protein
MSTLEARLRQLQRRFLDANLRSRSLRLAKPTRAGVLDLVRARDAEPRTWDALMAALAPSPSQEERTTLLLHTPAHTPTAHALDQDLSALARAAREDFLESGAEDLAVGWPLLEGLASDGTWLRAPLLLFPAKLQARAQGRAAWELVVGPPAPNRPLLQALRRLTGARPALGPASDDDEPWGLDPNTWRKLSQALRDQGLTLDDDEGARWCPLEARTLAQRASLPPGRFRLTHSLVLGRFPASGSNLPLDYEELLQRLPALEAGELARSPAAALLSVDEDAPWRESSPLEEHPQDSSQPEDARLWQVLDSDSSQDAVFRFLAQGAGAGLVVQGPPGTGKSQLITNLLASCVARGQRALLVCQKRAALDVVAARLASVGLGEPLALVHDVQRDRAALAEQVAATLAAQQDALASPAPRAAPSLAWLDRLRAGQASWEALTREDGPPSLAELQERALDDDGRPLPSLDEAMPLDPARETLAWLPRVEALAVQGARLAEPHPLWARGDWSKLEPPQVAAFLREVEGLLSELVPTLEAPAEGLTVPECARLAPLWEECAPLWPLLEGEDERARDDFALFWAWTDGKTRHGEWAKAVHAMERARPRLLPTPTGLVTSSKQALTAWIEGLARLQALRGLWYRFALPEFWRLRPLPAEILARCGPLEPALVQPGELCQRALEWHALAEALPSHNPLLPMGFRGDPAEVDEALAELRLNHARVLAVHALRAGLEGLGSAWRGLDLPREEDGFWGARVFRAGLAGVKVARALRDLSRRLQDCEPVWSREGIEALWGMFSRGEVARGRAALEAILASRGDLAEAAALDRSAAPFPAWAKRFLRRWRGGASAGADARCALERSWRAWRLGGAHPLALEGPLVDEAQLVALDAEQRGALGAVSGAALARWRGRLRAASLDGAGGAALRRLEGDLARKRNRPTLRQLVERHWEGGLALARPVWLCSPEAVAALFPMQAGVFDVIIFDEASQCPVEAALPVLARAPLALIAGDDQQMPPSHFFRAAAEDEPEDDEDEGALLASHSLLALGRVAFPGTTLRWHYRSQHEALIAFSNAAFYGGRLITAPRLHETARERAEGLRWEAVEGRWREQQNEAEAQRAVELVLSALAQPSPPSVGVVAFNQKQADLIARRLDQASREPAWARLFERDRQRPAVDQLIVRNLENIQGDERDWIVFSVGYGPEQPGGRIYARFGPLGQEGGEKRLNVAVTRARRAVWLLCSFDPDALSVESSLRPGPRLLKLYLRYARAASRGEPVEALLAEAQALGGGGGVTGQSREAARGARVGLRVRLELARALAERGLRVQEGLGLGSHRLDLALGVKGEEGWRLGVECVEFLHEPDAMARDLHGPRFWRRLGWRIVRVTPAMWLHAREATLDRLVALCARRP